MKTYYADITGRPEDDTFKRFKDDPTHTFVQIGPKGGKWRDFYCQGTGHLHLTAGEKAEQAAALFALVGKIDVEDEPLEFETVDFEFHTNRRSVTIGTLEDGQRVVYCKLTRGRGLTLRL
jgi:hypothetical protein